MGRSKLTFQKSEKKDSQAEPLMDEGSELVGKVVFSLSSGVGRITSISKINESSDDYYVVNFETSTAVDYIRIDSAHSFRVISSDEEFEKALNELESGTILKKFDSKKDRVHYFKSLEQQYDLDSLIELIKQMSGHDDLGSIEKKVLQRGIDSLIEEFKVHKKLSDDQSREKIEYLISA